MGRKGVRCTDLAELETVVDAVLERSHLHFADEFWLHLGVAENGREEFVEVREKDFHLIVDG